MSELTLLSVNQAAIILKVHPLTVRRYIREGKLEAVKVAGNVRIPEEALHNFTQAITPDQTKRAVKIERQGVFELTDPIFRLKARGISMKGKL